MMKANRRYADLVGAIDEVHMPESMKVWMKNRWLEQVRWFDHKAERANNWYYGLRIVAICGGVMVPALVSLDATSHADTNGHVTGPWSVVKPATFIISLCVAIAVGLDGFFHWGERWRQYRRTAELLMSEGWLFLEGAGNYRLRRGSNRFTHEILFPAFADEVENMVRRDVETYMRRVVQEGPDERKRKEDAVASDLDGVDMNETAASSETQ